jgi:hypothetical protein
MQRLVNGNDEGNGDSTPRSRLGLVSRVPRLRCLQACESPDMYEDGNDTE